MTVLVLARDIDWSADRLVEALTERGVPRFLDTFGLHFGAFDFAVTPGGEWIMLECNPFGEYGWLEDKLDLPITSALADLLANGAPAC